MKLELCARRQDFTRSVGIMIVQCREFPVTALLVKRRRRPYVWPKASHLIGAPHALGSKTSNKLGYPFQKYYQKVQTAIITT